MATLGTFQYQQEWDTQLAVRLDKPQNWKDVCDVRYSNTQTIILPYISTAGEPPVTTGQFASAAERSDTTKVIPLITVTQSSETLQIISTDMDSVYFDYADEAQSQYTNQMTMADLLGKKIGERTEAIVLGNHAAWTDFGDNGAGGVGLASSQITISNTNIDDVIRGIIEQIQTANGFTLYQEKGGFVVWRPQDWTNLVAFMQANGYSFADESLRDGGKGRIGKETMGLYHYVSTSHTANHLMAGVRGVQILGLLNRTYGKTFVNEHPASSTAGNLSGTQIYARLDYGLKVQTNVKPTIYDINVV